MKQRTIILFIFLFALLVAGMISYALIRQQELTQSLIRIYG